MNYEKLLERLKHITSLILYILSFIDRFDIDINNLIRVEKNKNNINVLYINNQFQCLLTENESNTLKNLLSFGVIELDNTSAEISNLMEILKILKDNNILESNFYRFKLNSKSIKLLEKFYEDDKENKC